MFGAPGRTPYLSIAYEKLIFFCERNFRPMEFGFTLCTKFENFYRAL